jgi:DNA-binding response OmpR family regulator
MSQATILIIEDDASILFSLRDALELAGYRVRAAVEGNLGLKLAMEETPDLILLDLMLPGLNGLQICQELRRCDKAMPIIMVSALGQEADVIRGLNLGADDYVTKPFSIAQLLARIASFLRRHRSQDAKVIEFAPGLKLNTTARTLSRAGQPVELTPKEYGLLDYLIRSAGRALTRDQILNAVWGGDSDVSERSVDRAVTTLRGKIEADPARPRLLLTVQRVGYRFVTE